MSDRPDDTNEVSDDPDAAAAAVQSTRSRMRETLGSLGERIKPGRLVETAKAALLDGDHEGAATALGFIRRHPIPIVLSTAGLAWLGVSIIRDGIEEDTPKPRKALPPPASTPDDDIHGMPYGGTPTTRIATDRGAAFVGGDRYGSPVARGVADAPRSEPLGASRGEPWGEPRGEMSDAARTVRRRASEMADKTREAVRRQASLAREGIVGGAEKAGSVMSRAASSVKGTFNEHPVLFGVAGLALGALVGIVIPRTRREDLMIGDQSDAFARRAKAEARDLVQRGKAVAREGIDAAKAELAELADDAKAHGRALLDEAKDAARQTGEEVADAAEEQIRQKKRDFPHADSTVDYRGRAPGQTNRDAEGHVESRLSASELFGQSAPPSSRRQPPPPPPVGAGLGHPSPTLGGASPATHASTHASTRTAGRRGDDEPV
ncbi:MAG: DUF3618 domain-containing protein [Myxococcales bacterium]|nr:DUF3618 domain-containing protein [Myxococcales bacterium]